MERAWRAVGAAELARARGRNDPKLWVTAATEWDAITRPFQRAIALWRATEAYVEAGDRRCGLRHGAERARDLRPTGRSVARRRAERAGSAGSTRPRRERARAADGGRGGAGSDGEEPFGLTGRERQVLALVAEGATNRQIGAALFMAEKTASVHVSRILSKLGVRSRTQAAAVAHRMHLD